MLEKQHDLLRLIVEKMEIRAEADEKDEGSSPLAVAGSATSVSAFATIVQQKIIANRTAKRR